MSRDGTARGASELALRHHGAVTEYSGPVVDSHHHVWDLTVRDQPFLRQAGYPELMRAFDVDDLLPLAIAAGVSQTVVVQTVNEPTETPELMTLAAAGGIVAGAVGWVDMADPAVADTLAALQARPDGTRLRGIRHPLMVEDDPGWLQRPAVLHGLAALAAAGLCFDLVLWPAQLPAALTAARAVPGLTFVLDHLGNPSVEPRPSEQWVRAVTALAGAPNTVCKLSGVLGEPPPDSQGPGPAAAGPGPCVAHLVPYYDTVLAAFGPERLMFGSDWPVCTVASPYPAVVAAARGLTATLSPGEQEQIFAGTARRAYRLAPAPTTRTS
jgi:L-fuconolactonase